MRNCDIYFQLYKNEIKLSEFYNRFFVMVHLVKLINDQYNRGEIISFNMIIQHYRI